MSLVSWFLIILAAVVLFVIYLFNSLVRLNNRTKEAWNDIKLQLKRRFELIPDLMKTVQAAISLDEKLLTEITRLRSQAIDLDAQDASPAERAKVEGQLGNVLAGLKVQVEAYPEIRAHSEIAQFMDELTDTQNKILAAQRFYNANVRDFNTKIELFPNNIFAGLLGFKPYEFFEVSEAEQTKPDINLEV